MYICKNFEELCLNEVDWCRVRSWTFKLCTHVESRFWDVWSIFWVSPLSGGIYLKSHCEGYQLHNRWKDRQVRNKTYMIQGIFRAIIGPVVLLNDLVYQSIIHVGVLPDLSTNPEAGATECMYLVSCWLLRKWKVRSTDPTGPMTLRCWILVDLTELSGVKLGMLNMTRIFIPSQARNKNNDLFFWQKTNSSHAKHLQVLISRPFVCCDLCEPLLLHTILELYTHSSPDKSSPVHCISLPIFFPNGHSVGETSSSTCTICPVGRASPSAGLAGLSSCAFCDAGRCQWQSCCWYWHCGDSLGLKLSCYGDASGNVQMIAL